MDMRDAVENCNSSPLWANLRATSCLATPESTQEGFSFSDQSRIGLETRANHKCGLVFFAVRSLRLLCPTVDGQNIQTLQHALC